MENLQSSTPPTASQGVRWLCDCLHEDDDDGAGESDDGDSLR